MWTYVAAYRPLMPPPPPYTLVFEFMGCNNQTAAFNLTAFLPGYGVQNSTLEVQIGQSGPWTEIFGGATSCPSVNLDSRTNAKAVLETLFGVSVCTVTIPGDYCWGQPPSGPFL